MEFSVLSICNKFESQLMVQPRPSSTLFWPTKRWMGLVLQGQICYLYFLWVQIAQQHKYIRAQCNSFKSLTHRWMHFMKPKLNGCQHGIHENSHFFLSHRSWESLRVLMGVFCLEALDTQSVQSFPNNAKIQRPARVRSTPSNHSNLREIRSSIQAPPLPP